MSGTPTRVYVARLAGLPVYDPQGDQVGKLRDVVVSLRGTTARLRVLGLVLEVFGRRKVFLPIGRVTSIDTGQVITTGLLNLRRFEQRAGETRVLGELLDRSVLLPGGEATGTVYDVAMEQDRNHDWALVKVALRQRSNRFGRKGQDHILDIGDAAGLIGEEEGQEATNLLATLDTLRPADLADVLHDLSPKRRNEIAAALEDERLADVLEELPEEDQVEILGRLDTERAADVLEEMSPDDAADLIAELPPETAEHLLALMEPDEAEDVRRLLSYEEHTAGGMMTTEPVILAPDATGADALARLRHPELTPSLAAMAYVCRPPLETPTGRFLGVVHVQRLLREPPSTLVSGMADNDIEPLRPTATLPEVARLLAAYNLVASPVTDGGGHLVGVVSVDDVLDHMLPDDWREHGAAPDAAPRTGAQAEVGRGA
ncbi:MAG: CBS domain-containing protein [Nocardioidaceae bacterium]|nr:CBS domain-containing protein [Nocardioidaceae bacterium]